MQKTKKLTGKAIAGIVIALILALAISGVSVYGALFITRFSVGVKPTAEQISSAKHYDHVVIFGVDGAGAYFKDGDVPNFDRIYKDGNVTYTAYSQYPTTSAHNWTSMFHGVRYQVHGVDNDVAGSTRFTNDAYPSFFKIYSELNPGAEMLSAVKWEPINYGSIEEGIPGMLKINGSDYAKEGANDREQDDAVCEYVLNYLDTSTPDILFMQFDNVDGEGHDDGYGSEGFAEALTHVDTYIGKIYDKYVANGNGDNTLFITVSDHGHGVQYPGHGHNGATQRYVTVAVAGGQGNIIKGTPGHVATQDIASIVAYAIGFEQPDGWESKVPYGMFTDLPTNIFAEMIK